MRSNADIERSSWRSRVGARYRARTDSWPARGRLVLSKRYGRESPSIATAAGTEARRAVKPRSRMAEPAVAPSAAPVVPPSASHVVVGGGVHGLSVASALARRLSVNGVSSGVVLVERSKLGSGASGIAGGI